MAEIPCFCGQELDHSVVFETNARYVQLPEPIANELNRCGKPCWKGICASPHSLDVVCRLRYGLRRTKMNGSVTLAEKSSEGGVADGTRTRNNKLHKLGLYH